MTPDSLQSTARLDSTRTPDQLTARRGRSTSNTPEQSSVGGTKRAASKTPDRFNTGRTPEVKREHMDMVTQTVISAGNKFVNNKYENIESNVFRVS